MLEIALILACTSGKGCTEATASYFYYRPDLKEALQHQEVRLKNLVQPFVYQYVGPAAICLAREECSVKIGRDLFLERHANSWGFSYKLGF